MRSLALALLALLFAAPAALAQELRGAVTDSASGQVVPGTVLLVLDSAGRTIGRNIANELGRYRVARPPAARRLRAMRIGYRPRELDLPAAPAAQLDVSLVAIPVLLEAVRVTATESRCPQRRDTPEALALLDQARAGLLAVVVAREANPATLVRLGYTRHMQGSSNRVARQTVRMDSVAMSGVSFDAVRTPAEFLRLGFVAERWGVKTFLAPDADVLLDDAFAQGYCFRIAGRDRARPNQVGLGFQSADRVDGRIDIAGTLWVDTVARTLVDVTFRYSGLERQVDSYRPGGAISFRTMPNGLVLIDRWTMRLVGIEQDSVPDARTRMWAVRNWYRVSESGGELARAIWPGGLVWRAPLGRARIAATTASGAAAAGVVFRLDSTPYRARADSAGMAELAELVPGPYRVMVIDPRLADIGLELTTAARFIASRDSTARLAITVPTAEDTTARRCAEHRRVTAADTSFVLGRVVNPRGEPLGDVRVGLSRVVRAGVESELAEYTTGSDGLFQFCHAMLMSGETIAVYGSRGPARARVTHTVEPRLTIVRVPLTP